MKNLLLIKRFAKSNKVFVSVGSIPFKKTKNFLIDLY